MSIDLALDTLTHDLLIQTNDLQLVKDSNQIDQNTKIRLLFFRGEWFLDTISGLPFYEEILVRNPNLPDIDNIIKAQITDTNDVTELIEYRSNFDTKNRTYTIVFKYKDSFGNINGTTITI